MCGIVGILNMDGMPVRADELARMTDRLAHRGPDGDNLYVDGPVGLGHRRLAIIDLSTAAAQPMATSDQRYVISYNGEVYNFEELRRELVQNGYQFQSRSDSEVVLASLARWGAHALDRFNGMFAFALWDRRRRSLLLARDRYGIKPLYYTQVGNTVVFGSEIKAILVHPRVSCRLDYEGLVEYLTFQNFFTDRTLFDGIRLLPPGCLLNIDCDMSAIPLPERYWDFSFSDPETAADARDYGEELDRLFCDAVTRQLVSDVPVSSYLSGGMDSGSIAAIASRKIPNLTTFTVGFDVRSASGIEIVCDEREQAEFMSYLFQTQHYEMVLKSGDMERAMTTLMWHLEEPRVGQSYPNYYAAMLASKFGKVVLSGTGGDELFGGYPWRYLRPDGRESFDDYTTRYALLWQRLAPQYTLEGLLTPIWSDVSHVSTRDIFRSVFPPSERASFDAENAVNTSLYLEAKTFLHGLLVVEDKLSMAWGLETRVPFLDNNLVEFAQQVPSTLKVGNEPGGPGFQRTRQGKLLLRQVMQRYLPAEVTLAAKQGFSAPDASWFRGESIDYVRQLLWQGTPRIYEFLDRKTAESLMQDHLDGRQNRRLLIWSLVCLEHWCRTFLDPVSGFSQSEPF